MSNRVIEVTVDTNDADYVAEISHVPDDKEADIASFFQKVLDSGRLEESEYHQYSNWTDPKFTEEDFDMYGDLFPYCEYGFHTVEGVKFYTVSDEVRLVKS